MLHHHIHTSHTHLALKNVVTVSSYQNVSRWFNYCSEKQQIKKVANEMKSEEVCSLAHTHKHI